MIHPNNNVKFSRYVRVGFVLQPVSISYKEASLSSQYRSVSKPNEVAELLDSFLSKRDREHFGVLCVDTKNQPTNISIVSIGNLNSAIVHPREVFKTAILSNAASIILFHNHPSGNPEPSTQDVELTNRLMNSGELLGIQVLDHIIVGDECFVSLNERNLMGLALSA